MNLHNVFDNYQPPTTNIVDRLRYWAGEIPEQTAFIFLADGEDKEERITFRQLDRKARAIAADLQKRGLAGERALLLYPQGLNFVLGFFGCLYAGVVAVPAFPPKKNRNMLRVQAISDDALARIALTDSDVLERTIGTLSEAPHLESLTWLGTDTVEESLADEWVPPQIEPTTLAVLQYTSGSTGVPKGVMITHANVMHNTSLVTHGFGPHREDIGMSWLPTYHDMGLVGGVLQPVFLGRMNVLMSPMSFLTKPARWLQAISKHGVQISGGPNFAYQLCIEKVREKDLQGVDLSCWKVAFNGAEPVRQETLAEFSEKFASVGFRANSHYPCYGMAETTLIVAGGVRDEMPVVKTFDRDGLEQNRGVEVKPGDENGRELIGCGAPLPECDVRIVDPETCHEMPAGSIGEIWVNSPSVAAGYWRNEEATEEIFRARLVDGPDHYYLRSGDLGFLHEGQLYVTGRRKDMIIVRGVNRYPQDIEETVESIHKRIRRGHVGAFSVDMHGREQLVIVAEVERSRDQDWQEVLTAVRSAISTQHDLPPDAVILVRNGTIPKTSSGKIQRFACKQGFTEKTLLVVADWYSWSAEPAANATASNGKAIAQKTETDDEVLDIVIQQVRNIAKERAGEVDPDASIVELGLDSLERMEIAANLEDLFGGRFPEYVLPEIETCREIAAAVEQHLGSRPRPMSTRPELYVVPEEYYRFDKLPEYNQLQATEAMLQSTGVPNPYFAVHQSVTNDQTMIDGKEYINFSSYNYLSMSGDPAVSRAAQDAIEKYGTSVSASRLVSGEKPLHGELEKAIAEFLGVPASLLFMGGHATNETTIGHLMKPGDLIVHDGLAHNSIVQGSILSGARRRPFPHNDWETLDEILNQVRHEYRKVLIAIEGVYSMDGDFPDLPKFIEVKKKHKALLMIDEAHSLGTMGLHGRGIGEHFGVDPKDVDIWMGTISKALGSGGGYIAGANELIKYMKYTAPGFVFAAGISPPSAAAALAALRLLEDEPHRVATLAKRSELFLRLAKEHGLNTGTSSGTPVVPVILGNSIHALTVSQGLMSRGINVQPILYPAVEESAARLRFFITSSHSEQQIRQTVTAVAEELEKIDPAYVQGKNDATTGTTRTQGQLA